MGVQRIPSAVKGLSLVSLFNDFASEMVYPLLPAFITRTLGGSATMLGALDGAADLAAAATKWVSGRLSDRRGWTKPLILGGYLSAILIRPLMAVTSAGWQVVGFRVLDRIGKGARTPARDALIAHLSPPEVRGRAFGFHRGADHFGAVLGSITAWWLLQRQVEVRDVLAWSIVPGLVAFLVLLVVLRGPGAEVPGAGVGPPVVGCEPITRAVFWPPVLTLAALTFFRLPEMLLILRLQDLGVSIALIPLVWAGLHVVRTAASYPGGWMTDRIGPRLTVFAGGALSAVIAVFLGLDLTATLAIATFLAFGLVAGLMESSERVLVARLAPVKTGRGFGAYHAVIGGAALPAGLFFGWMYQHLGGSTALWISAGAIGVMLVVWLGVSRRFQNTPADQSELR